MKEGETCRMNTMVLIENAEISNTELNDLNDNKTM